MSGGNNPRHERALEMLERALAEVSSATLLLEDGHPDRDLLDDVHADLQYTVLKLRGRLAVPP